MSSSTIVLIAILAAVFLAFVMVMTTARRRDTGRALGKLSKETLDRDRSGRTAGSPATKRETTRRASSRSGSRGFRRSERGQGGGSG